MEDPAKNHFTPKGRVSARTLADPDFIGADAALKRAAAKAIERAHRAGLEPIVMKSSAQSMESMVREDPTPYGNKPE
jgi:lysylphosphatidylglycerol synthetase-like protein (DUF2156 family)